MSWVRTSIAFVLSLPFGLVVPRYLAAQENIQSMYRGTVNCEQCHTKPTGSIEDTDALKRVSLTEAATWSGPDFHSKAYKNLSNEWGKQIGQLMDVNVLDPARGCVQCHATSVDEKRWGATVKFDSEGVGCEACHGPSSKWVAEHQQYKFWNEEIKDEKKAELGWIDVRSPVKRAEICLSCHVGSADDDRVITHDMYAAGHPPLSGFEIESFVNRMPAHWRYPYEKDEDKKTFDRTRNILIGSVVALRMSIDLALKGAQQNGTLDFARLDCYACHHDLANSQWRQLREAHGIPGRPPLAVGSIPIVEVAARVVQGKDSAQQIDGLVEQLRTPFVEATFGDPDQLASLGPMVVAGCKKLEGKLNKGLTAEQARQVLYDLAQFGASEPVDFDTARQLMGAWLVVYQELEDNQAIDLDEDTKKRIESLLGQIRKNDFFVLDQATGRAAEDKPDHESIDERVEILFRDRINYNPEKFAAVMKQLAEWTRPQSVSPAP